MIWASEMFATSKKRNVLDKNPRHIYMTIFTVLAPSSSNIERVMYTASLDQTKLKSENISLL